MKRDPRTDRVWTMAGLSFATAALTLTSLPSLAAPESSSLVRKQESWSQLNYYSPTEGFHSKGSYGFSVGLGVLAPSGAEGPAVAETATLGDDEVKDDKVQPRLFLGKGTPWPVDFGASFSILEGKKAMQAGGHIQWTVFEGFQLPSIAFRGSHSELRNYREVKSLATEAVELGISYGIIRYVILSAGVSQQWERGETQAREDYLTLAESELPAWKTSRTVYSWGVNISPFTPFVQIGLEQSYWDSRTQVSLAKLSFLL